MTNDNRKKKRQTAAVPLSTVPDWYGWLAVAAMFLLPFPALSALLGGDWLAGHLSPGEWLILPLGVLSLTLGLLTLGRIPERTILPLWMAAAAPGVLWLAAEALAMIKNGMGRSGGDLMIAWIARLVFPALAFLPLLAETLWRDRLYWALAGGLFVNLAVVVSRMLSAPDVVAYVQPGLLYNHHDYGLFLVMALPLLAGWRGGGTRKNQALILVSCMFLLPAIAMTTLFSGGLLLALAAGLAVTWAAWRGHGWLLGVFLCLLVIGYGAEGKRERDRTQRVVIAGSMSPVSPEGGLSLRLAAFDAALATFVERPFLGIGPDVFFSGADGAYGKNADDGLDAPPWYATLLGSSGLAGLLMWIVLLAELLGRAVGRKGKSCANAGGVAGAAVGLAAAGIWTNVLTPGAGALIGFILAVSILDESEIDAPPRQRKRLASDSIVMRRTRIMERVGGKKAQPAEDKPPAAAPDDPAPAQTPEP